ncbi:hypothetical protein JYQ62_02115 [Nostoc sp. UHCC 0702]|nr:hypothetical protein JYQ62_02115 [Nostoc sp. UHCC 0702]
MSITTFNQSQAFTIKLDSTSGSNIIQLFDISPYTSNSGNVIAENIFIKNLKAYAKISSLEQIQLPDIGLEDSDFQRNVKIRNVEWTSPRKQINLFFRETAGQWNPFGSVSLLNPSGYPYRMYSLQDIFTDNLAIELGSNGQIGVQIQDVGYGLLAGSDIVTICGTYIKEIVLQSPAIISSTTPLAVAVNNTATAILTANNNRKYVALTNPGDNPAWINLGSIATLNQGIYLAGKGGSFDFSVVDVPYFGVISAISSGNTTITGVESV